MDLYPGKKQKKVICGQQTDRERQVYGESEFTRNREQTLRLRREDQSVGQSSVDVQC